MHFRLAGDGENQWICQFLNWQMKAAFAAFGHDSSPPRETKTDRHRTCLFLLVESGGLEPSTFRV